MEGPRSSDVARQSVRNLLRLLTEVIADKGSELKIESLTSQANLARVCVPAKAVVSMSLNTCKRAADDGLPGGFSQLDVARKTALTALRRREGIPTDGSPRTKNGLERKLREQQAQIALLEEDLAQITGAFYFTVRCARKYARLSKQPDLMRQFAFDLEEIRARASLVKTRLYLAHDTRGQSNAA